MIPRVRSTAGQGKDSCCDLRKSKKAVTESGTSLEASRTVMERSTDVGSIAGRSSPQRLTRKKQQQSANVRQCQVPRSRTAGVRNGDARATPLSPQTNVPAADSCSQERWKKVSGQLGKMPRTNRRDQQRCCWGASPRLSLWQRGLASTCGDAIAHIMEFAARKNPSKTTRDWRAE